MFWRQRRPARPAADAAGGDGARHRDCRSSTTRSSARPTSRGGSRARPASTRSRSGRSRWRWRRWRSPPGSATAAVRERFSPPQRGRGRSLRWSSTYCPRPSFSATPLHAFDGITIPLAVLAVDGVRRVRWQRIPRPRLVAGLAVCAATIPATAYELNVAPEFMAPTPGNANFITSDERRALEFPRQRPGSRRRADPLLSRRGRAGADRPAHVRRQLPVVRAAMHVRARRSPRSCSTARCPPAAVRAFVRSTGARFVLSDCQLPGDLTPVLAPISVIDPPLRLRERVRARCAGPAAGASGRITAPCGCSRFEAPIASSATKPTRSSPPPTR